MELVLEEVRLILRQLHLAFHVQDEFVLDLHFSIQGAFLLLQQLDLGFMLGLDGLENDDFLGLLINELVLPLDGVLGTDQVVLHPLVLDLQLPVHGVHAVQLGLELEPQLHLFLMVLRVLHVLLLQLQPQRPLISPLFLQLLRILLEHLHVLLEDLLVVEELLALGLELHFHLSHLLLVLVGDLRDQHPVVALAAVLQHHRKHLPNRGDDLVLLVGVREDLLDELIEAYRVHKQAPVDPIHGGVGDARVS